MPRVSDSNVHRKKKKKKKKARVLFARFIFALLILLLITAIGFGAYKVYSVLSSGFDDDVSTTTIVVSKGGEIRQTIIEEFNPGFYDAASLKTDVEEKIAASNGHVKSEGLDVEGGMATLKLIYDSDEDMATFNDQVFYSDTIENLLSRGVRFDSRALDCGGKYAVIVSDKTDIRCPKKILYTDGAMAVDEDDPKLAHCSVREGDIAFLIY